jgi:hypothetical protein
VRADGLSSDHADVDSTPVPRVRRDVPPRHPGVEGQERDRAKIPDRYKWNLADLYPSEEAWRAAKEKVLKEIPPLAAFKGTLAQSPQRLADALDAANRVGKEFQRVAVYAGLISDQDTRVSKYQGMQQEIQQSGAMFGETVSFLEPEILKIDKATIDTWMAQEPRLKTYAHYLDDIQRRRAHTLSDCRGAADGFLVTGGGAALVDLQHLLERRLPLSVRHARRRQDGEARRLRLQPLSRRPGSRGSQEGDERLLHRARASTTALRRGAERAGPEQRVRRRRAPLQGAPSRPRSTPTTSRPPVYRAWWTA